jgi:hypothetical protein
MRGIRHATRASHISSSAPSSIEEQIPTSSESISDLADFNFHILSAKLSIRHSLLGHQQDRQ